MAGKRSEEEKAGARLGSILMLAELVNEGQMAQAMEIASALSLPLGKALVMLGILSSSQLVAAIELQSLLRDRLVDVPTVKAALKLVKEENLSVGAALAQSGWTPKDDGIFTKLGELLLEAKIISNGQLKEALGIASKTHMPLGRVLIINNMLTHSVLWSALNAQVLVRDKRIDRKQAVSGLKAAHERQKTLEHTLMEQGIQFQTGASKLKLGDILVMSGLLTEQDLLNALESCLLTDKPMGQVLIQKGLLTQVAIETALLIQDMVSKESIPPVAAGELLKQVVSHGKTLAQAVQELGIIQAVAPESLRLGDLLKRAGVITDSDIDEALQLSAKNTSLLGKILVATGHIDERTLHAGIRCQFLIREGVLSEERGVVALYYCQRMRCSFDDALSELGWAAGASGTAENAPSQSNT